MRNWIEAVGVDEADLDRMGLGVEEIAARPAGAEIVEDAEPPVTVYFAQPVPDYHQHVGALDQRIVDAEVKLKSGKLTFDEFRVGRITFARTASAIRRIARSADEYLYGRR
jgi:hypothetical protein